VGGEGKSRDGRFRFFLMPFRAAGKTERRFLDSFPSPAEPGLTLKAAAMAKRDLLGRLETPGLRRSRSNISRKVARFLSGLGGDSRVGAWKGGRPLFFCREGPRAFGFFGPPCGQKGFPFFSQKKSPGALLLKGFSDEVGLSNAPGRGSKIGPVKADEARASQIGSGGAFGAIRKQSRHFR